MAPSQSPDRATGPDLPVLVELAETSIVDALHGRATHVEVDAGVTDGCRGAFVTLTVDGMLDHVIPLRFRMKCALF